MNTGTYHGIKVYNGILEQLKHIHDTEQDSLNEVRHYAKGFPKEVDFNLAQYGSLLVFYVQVREFYESCEYPRLNELDDSDIWEMYKKDVGYVATRVMLGKVNPLPMRMYRLKVRLPEPCTTIPIMEWIKSHKEDAERLDHTHFHYFKDNYSEAVVSVYLRDGSLEDAIAYCNDDEPLNAFEHKGMRRYCLWNCYYFEIDNNVYLCTF